MRVMKWCCRHKIIIAFIVVLAGLFCSWRYYEIQFYKSKIPSKIETHFWPVAINGGYGIFGSCGSASFTLTDDTVQQIEAAGLAFFKDATEAKNKHPFIKKNMITAYPEWKETPLWNGGLGDGGYSDIVGCNSSLSESRKKNIADAALSSGSYHSRINESGWLLVLPKLKIILFIFNK